MLEALIRLHKDMPQKKDKKKYELKPCNCFFE